MLTRWFGILTIMVFAGMAYADDFVPSDEDDLAISADVFTLDGDNTGGNVTLQFGATLAEGLQWDSVNSRFSLSDSIDLQNNQLVNTRLENLATAPTCDATVLGKTYFNSTDLRSYVCDGSSWVNQTAGSLSEVVSTVKSYTQGLKTELVANGGVEGGNAGKATLFVLNTTDGKAQITSLADGNVVQAFLTGFDFENNSPQETVFLKKGEIYVFENLQNGSVINSSEGAYGYSGQLLGGDESPMPLGSLAFSFTDTFFFAFRNSTISPGSPVDMDAGIGVGTGANDADYEPNGATRFKATGLISGYSGADSAGLEASPLWPTKSFVQRVALPLQILNAGDGGNNGIAITSPYEGTAEIYEWDPVLEVANLAYTVPLTRNIGGTTTREDQNHPASALVSANAAESTVQLTSAFYGGYVEADVPIHVVFNSEQNQNGATTVTRKGTSGAAVVGISADDDEQASTGITPNEIRNETRTDANGLLRRRVIDGAGSETWVIQ